MAALLQNKHSSSGVCQTITKLSRRLAGWLDIIAGVEEEGNVITVFAHTRPAVHGGAVNYISGLRMKDRVT